MIKKWKWNKKKTLEMKSFSFFSLSFNLIWFFFYLAIGFFFEFDGRCDCEMIENIFSIRAQSSSSFKIIIIEWIIFNFLSFFIFFCAHFVRFPFRIYSNLKLNARLHLFQIRKSKSNFDSLMPRLFPVFIENGKCFSIFSFFFLVWLFKSVNWCEIFVCIEEALWIDSS